jgi:hypothetical protein
MGTIGWVRCVGAGRWLVAIVVLAGGVPRGTSANRRIAVAINDIVRNLFILELKIS